MWGATLIFKRPENYSNTTYNNKKIPFKFPKQKTSFGSEKNVPNDKPNRWKRFNIFARKLRPLDRRRDLINLSYSHQREMWKLWVTIFHLPSHSSSFFFRKKMWMHMREKAFERKSDLMFLTSSTNALCIKTCFWQKEQKLFLSIVAFLRHFLTYWLL